MLLPRAAVARDVIPAELAKLGAQVDVVEAYRNVVPPNAAARAREIFSAEKKPDWITFTSSSTVKNLLAIAGREAARRRSHRLHRPGDLRDRSCAHGLTVDAEAKQFTLDGLVEAILVGEK